MLGALQPDRFVFLDFTNAIRASYFTPFLLKLDSALPAAKKLSRAERSVSHWITWVYQVPNGFIY